MWSYVIQHLAEYKAAYLIPTVISGVALGVGGQVWMDARIDARITHASAPILSRLESIERRQARMDRRQIEEQLRAVAAELCVRPGGADLLARLEELQQDHVEVTALYDDDGRLIRAGERYPLPSCSMLVLPTPAN